MACDASREKLDAYVDRELSRAETSALEQHLRECAGCSADALQRLQLKKAIASAGKRYQPTAEFRARIAAVSRGKQSRSLGFWKIILVPALAVLLISLGVNWYVGRSKAQRQRVYSELADLHVSTLASATQVDVVSTDRHTVKPWFEGKIPFAFNLPELQGTKFTLLGGRVTYLEQMPGAHLIYRMGNHEISVFVFQDRGSINSSPSSSPIPEFSFTIESWTKGGLRYFVVGDVGESDLDALANLLRNAS